MDHFAVHIDEDRETAPIEGQSVTGRRGVGIVEIDPTGGILKRQTHFFDWGRLAVGGDIGHRRRLSLA
jgi:hypothetical protein